MPRAPFNVLADVYLGSASPFGPPGTLSVPNLPARLVPQPQILFGQFPLTAMTAWITAPNPMLNIAGGAHPSAGVAVMDYNFNDVIELPQGSGVFYGILTYQYVVPPVAPSYWRYYVCLMPFPF